MTLSLPKTRIAPVNLILIACAIFYAVIYFVYYPPIYAYRDEGSYLAMSYVMRQGTLYIDQTNIPVPWVHHFTHDVSHYPIGNSLLLIPFTLLHWKSVFLVGLIAHFLGLLVFIKLLDIFGFEDRKIALLYLFFPAFVFYSRTIMSDIPAMTIFLSACYFYFKDSPQQSGRNLFFSGIGFGVGFLFRTTNLILAFPFSLRLLVSAFRQKQGKSLFLFLAGLTPFLCGSAVINHFLYGSVWNTGYGFLCNFSPGFFLPHLGHYLVSFSLMYPFMAACFVTCRKIHKPEIIFAAILLGILYSFYYFYDWFPNPWLTKVFATRFLFPVIPFFIMAFGAALSGFLKKFPKPIQNFLVAGGLIILMAGSWAINREHQAVLNQQERLRHDVYQSTEKGSVLIYDSNAAELMQRIWGDRVYRRYDGWDEFQKVVETVRGSKIYFIRWNAFYQDSTIEGIPREEFQKIQKNYDLKEIVSDLGLSIYELKKHPMNILQELRGR